jgi:hypothetical protein
MIEGRIAAHAVGQGSARKSPKVNAATAGPNTSPTIAIRQLEIITGQKEGAA